MSFPLFIAEVGDAAPGDRLTISGDEAHHAVVVRRILAGETVLVSDGAGHGVRTKVLETARRAMTVEVLEVMSPTRRGYRLTAVQALAKGERSDLAVELLTETGVDEIIAWPAQRSIVKWSTERRDRSLAKWQATAREASKQARRFTIPEVRCATTSQLTERITGTTAFVLHETATTRLSDALNGFEGTEIVVITGPEGGITNGELTAFAEAGARPVRLTDHVLRTSTAGGVALAQIQAVLTQ